MGRMAYAVEWRLQGAPGLKQGQPRGRLTKFCIIPLNPPLKKGDLKSPAFKIWVVLYHTMFESQHQRAGQAGLRRPGPAYNSHPLCRHQRRDARRFPALRVARRSKARCFAVVSMTKKRSPGKIPGPLIFLWGGRLGRITAATGRPMTNFWGFGGKGKGRKPSPPPKPPPPIPYRG
jgi:hypothetical protein